jgi:hypothetical protein
MKRRVGTAAVKLLLSCNVVKRGEANVGTVDLAPGADSRRRNEFEKRLCLTSWSYEEVLEKIEEPYWGRSNLEAAGKGAFGVLFHPKRCSGRSDANTGANGPLSRAFCTTKTGTHGEGTEEH